MHLTTMPSALLAQILRTQDLRQKRVVAGDRGRSRRNMGLPAYGTRHPSAKILATEQSVRSRQTDSAPLPPADEEPGTDGMMISRGSVFATADSPEPDFPMIAGLRRPRFDAATPMKGVFHAKPDHEGNMANRAVQLIAGHHHFRAEAIVTRRSGTGPAKSRAGRVPSLHFRSIHPHRQPAIPDGGRSANK